MTKKRMLQVVLLLLLLSAVIAPSGCGGSTESPVNIPRMLLYLGVQELRMEDVFIEGTSVEFTVTLLVPEGWKPGPYDVAARVVGAGEAVNGETVVRMQFVTFWLNYGGGPVSELELAFPDEIHFGGAEYWKSLNSLAAGDYRLELFGPNVPSPHPPDMLHPVIVKEFVVIPEEQGTGA